MPIPGMEQLSQTILRTKRMCVPVPPDDGFNCNWGAVRLRPGATDMTNQQWGGRAAGLHARAHTHIYSHKPRSHIDTLSCIRMKQDAGLLKDSHTISMCSGCNSLHIKKLHQIELKRTGLEARLSGFNYWLNHWLNLRVSCWTFYASVSLLITLDYY